MLLLACASATPDAPSAPPPAQPAVDRPAAEAPPAPISAPASAPITVQADLHVDTPTQLFRRKVGLDRPGLESGLPEMQAGGTNLAVMVAWPPRDVDGAAHVRALVDLVRSEDERLDAVALATSPAEARRIVAEGRTALVLSIEGAHGLLHPGEPPDAGLRRLDELDGLGLRLLGLTWSNSNPYAGSSGDGGGGLTDAGRALVAAAQARGMLLDLSHASVATTREVCSTSKAPVIASHSNATAVHAHQRNLGDDALRCIAATGGVVGVNFHGPFLGSAPSVRAAADHLDHVKAVAGAGAVALGSDFDGLIQPPADLATARDLPALWAELARRGWTDAEIRGVRGENFLRAWEQMYSRRAPG